MWACPFQPQAAAFVLPTDVIAICIGQELADVQNIPTFREGKIGTLFGLNRAPPQTALQPHMRALRFPPVPLREVQTQELAVSQSSCWHLTLTSCHARVCAVGWAEPTGIEGMSVTMP